MNGTCLKSVSKTPTFRFFRDFQLFQHPADVQHPVKWPILDSFWPKWAKQDFFKKGFGTFFFALKNPNFEPFEAQSDLFWTTKISMSTILTVFQLKNEKIYIYITSIFGPKWPIFGQNGRNGIFFQKSAWNIFSAFTSPN